MQILNQVKFFIYQISWAFVNVIAVLMGISNGGNNAIGIQVLFPLVTHKIRKIFSNYLNTMHKKP